jgi:glycosyltransferase involved in cell wall biosynthesis
VPTSPPPRPADPTDRPLRFGLIAEGDAETNDCWSGCALGFVQGLRRAGHTVEVLNAELQGWRRYAVALATYSTDRELWRQRYILGPEGFGHRSAIARGLLRRTSPAYDVLVQVGATFRLPPVVPARLRVVYADANAALSREGGTYSELHRLPAATFDAIVARERAVYAATDRIWTFSDYVARSFRSAFGIPHDRVVPIYAGANRTELAGSEPPLDRKPGRRVLFVGKQYARKGLDVLLAAFAQVRASLPDAELHLVGPPRDVTTQEGVVSHGLLRADDPADAARLRALYREASVFCLPSRYEPFGVVFAEAMLAGLPCIGTDRWAMPEIIAEGETGLLVADGDIDGLAQAVRRLLSSPDEASAMGAAGRRRALERFTWDAVARRAAEDATQSVLPEDQARNSARRCRTTVGP